MAGSNLAVVGLAGALIFVVSRCAAVAAHELSHYAVARLLGYRASIHLWPSPHVFVKAVEDNPLCAELVRQAGWLFSATLAIFTWQARAAVAERLGLDPSLVAPLVAAAGLTAMDAFTSDCLRRVPPARKACCFYCGNFGVLLLEVAGTSKVIPLLRKMIQITSMRGAQSAGIVTYTRQGTAKPLSKRAGPPSQLVGGVRSRVVNGKRTDLTTLLMNKFERTVSSRRALGAEADLSAPQLFQGHTRFATSSISDLPGCHPHQWLMPSMQTVWRYDNTSRRFEGTHARSEAFITHNGARPPPVLLPCAPHLSHTTCPHLARALLSPPPVRTRPIDRRRDQATSTFLSFTASPTLSTTCEACSPPCCIAAPRPRSTRCALRGCSICTAQRVSGARPCAMAGSMVASPTPATCAARARLRHWLLLRSCGSRTSSRQNGRRCSPSSPTPRHVSSSRMPPRQSSRSRGGYARACRPKRRRPSAAPSSS